MDPTPGNRKDPEILMTHLMEGIGLAPDLKGGRMFMTDFGGSVYTTNLDGSNEKTLLFAEGSRPQHAPHASFCTNFVLVFYLRLTWPTILTFIICNLQIHRDCLEFDSHPRLHS